MTSSNAHLQSAITITITVERANEHAPRFEFLRYNVSIYEYNVLASSPRYVSGDVIATVLANDPDGDMLEYSITTGNELGIFGITQPSVSIILCDCSMCYILVLQCERQYSLCTVYSYARLGFTSTELWSMGLVSLKCCECTGYNVLCVSFVFCR